MEDLSDVSEERAAAILFASQYNVKALLKKQRAELKQHAPVIRESKQAILDFLQASDKQCICVPRGEGEKPVFMHLRVEHRLPKHLKAERIADAVSTGWDDDALQSAHATLQRRLKQRAQRERRKQSEVKEEGVPPHAQKRPRRGRAL